MPPWRNELSAYRRAAHDRLIPAYTALILMGVFHLGRDRSGPDRRDVFAAPPCECHDRPMSPAVRCRLLPRDDRLRADGHRILKCRRRWPKCRHPATQAGGHTRRDRDAPVRNRTSSSLHEGRGDSGPSPRPVLELKFDVDDLRHGDFGPGGQREDTEPAASLDSPDSVAWRVPEATQALQPLIWFTRRWTRPRVFDGTPPLRIAD